MKNHKQDCFWEQDANFWIEHLASRREGLSSAQANQLLTQLGIAQPSISPFKKDLLLFVRQFRSPLMLLLIGAVIISAFLGDHSDVYIILTIVLSTGLLSFFQERNASRVVAKLQSMIKITSKVKRDGILLELASNKMVPGDIIILQAGDMIPADCMVLEAKEFYINESSLTGESFPVRKEKDQPAIVDILKNRTHCLWQGTSVVSGHGEAIVINTGSDTIFGEIALQAARSFETSFEQGIKKFGYFLMTITLVLAVFILVVNISAHKSILESALFALALAVGMAPELLPAITTIAMSAGAKKLLAKKVIVKKLASIQNLGEVNLLCTDKTGTITEGVITIKNFVDVSGNYNEFVKKMAYWNAHLQSGYGNPIDDALKKISLLDNESYEKLDEVAYDFSRKRISVLVQTQKGILMITKGAYNEIASVCTQLVNEKEALVPFQICKNELDTIFESNGLNGYRTIAISYKYIQATHITREDEQGMTFAGFIQLEDPIKPNIVQVIDALTELSVQLKIITGDNKNIAVSIAHHIGIAHPVVFTGAMLAEYTEAELIRKVKSVHIFAEVEPHQKEHIIQLLRKSYTVAYMGDGINDVSAINVADVGISVENAVDIAKEAADFVLMEKELMVIVDGIVEGRKTFANTLKYIFINTGSTFGNMFSVAIASLLLPFLPMLPKQILLTNFITDFPYLSISSDNVDQKQLRKPGKWNLKLIRNYMILFGIHSTLFDIITFLTLLYVLKVKESAFQTGWFIESILTELCILFIIRTQLKFFKSKPGKYLILLSLLGTIITLSLPYTHLGFDIGLIPLPVLSVCAMVAIVILYVITADMLKVWFFKRGSKM
jgi:Mg2+-importing ATPase